MNAYRNALTAAHETIARLAEENTQLRAGRRSHPSPRVVAVAVLGVITPAVVFVAWCLAS